MKTTTTKKIVVEIDKFDLLLLLKQAGHKVPEKNVRFIGESGTGISKIYAEWEERNNV